MKTARVVQFVPFLCLLSCATPVPKPGDLHQLDPHTHTGLHVDLDLLATAKLPQDTKHAGEELLNVFHRTETRLTNYIDALEKNLEANEHLKNKYSVADSIVGALTGLSAPAVIVATAAIAIPIAGVIWIAIGLSVQHNNIDPQITEAAERLVEARLLAQLFPDVERAFDACVFADSEAEADRRFRKWKVYVEGLEAKVAHFIAKPIDK